MCDAGRLVLYAVAGNPLMLALARISHGIGGGLVGPSTMALASDAATEERRGRAMAVYGISIAIAVIIGTGIAGPITARLGFVALFSGTAGSAAHWISTSSARRATVRMSEKVSIPTSWPSLNL